MSSSPSDSAATPARMASASGAEGPRVVVPVAVLVVVAAVLVGVLVVGLVVWASEPRLPIGPAVAPPAPQAHVAPVDYDAATRSALIDEARLTLPGAPYVCEPGPESKPPAFTSLISCYVLVHENYNAKGDDAYGRVGFGIPERSMVVRGDLAGTADKVFNRLRTALFYGEQTSVEKRTSGAVEVGAAGGSRSVAGNVTYELKGLPSSYDRLLVVVLELQSGDYAVLYSDRPDDLPRAGRDALNSSLSTLSARQ